MHPIRETVNYQGWFGIKNKLYFLRRPICRFERQNNIFGDFYVFKTSGCGTLELLL